MRFKEPDPERPILLGKKPRPSPAQAQPDSSQDVRFIDTFAKKPKTQRIKKIPRP